MSDQGPSTYAANDSFGSVLSQVKQALPAWNSVSTSDLRVAFGGLESYTPNPTTAAPGGPREFRYAGRRRDFRRPASGSSRFERADDFHRGGEWPERPVLIRLCAAW